jgi:hypothetical protein
MGRLGRWQLGWSLGAVLAMGVADAKKLERPAVVSFRSDASVWLDADGVPVRVEVGESLPPEIARIVQARIGQWRFGTPQVGGRPVGGLTHVDVFACAVQGADGTYGMRVRYGSNGPRALADGAPRYPRDSAREGDRGNFVVDVLVEADGSVVVESIEPVPGEGPANPLPFKESIRKWMGGRRYRPEEVDGRAVQTRMRIPVGFSVSGSSPVRHDIPAASRPRDADGCELPTTGAGGTGMSVQSPFRWLGGQEGS